MARPIRRSAAVLFSLVLLFAAAGQALGGFPQDWEPLVFEVTLTGDVDASDTFAIEHSCDTAAECIFIEPFSVVCSADERQQEDWGSPACSAQTYRLELKREAGVTVQYGLARWRGSFDGQPTHMLADSVTVPEGGITLRLGYEYAGGAAPALPDTATTRGEPIPTGAASLTLLVLAGAAISIGLHRRRRLQGPA